MTEENKNFKLRLNLSKREYEVEGSKSFVEDWADKLEDKLESSSVSKNDTEKQNTSQRDNSKEKSIAEVYEHEKFNKRQNALFIGWALEVVRGEEEFTKSDIEDVAQEFKIELGANLTRDVKSLIKKGKMKKVGEEDGETTYYLTRTGEQFIEEKVE